MKKGLALSFCMIFIVLCGTAFAQDTTAVFKWKVTGKKLADHQYELQFTTSGAKGWQLYAPNQILGDVATTALQFSDSSIQSEKNFKDSGSVKTVNSKIFEGTAVKISEGPTTWKKVITIPGQVPATLQGEMQYTYGRSDEFYPSTAFDFSIPLEGGVAANTRIAISTIDIQNPVNGCGDTTTTNKGFSKLFFLGFGAGLLSLLFPCIFPLIPMTVSFFTKRSGNRKKGITNALWYGFSIFLIYTLLSLPFHLFNIQPEVLNNISTNVWLNVFFFIVFVVFAISFFGYFEITLPSGFANKVDSRSGLSDFWGIFFMALTLAIVSFSCTSGILGALLVGALSSQGGAWQLTAGMAGFGLGLGLPFVLFALFPNWLQSMPKSGSWMNELKVVFGFIELAMAIKFLSQADLVKQWGILRREVFIGLWIIIGFTIVLYLLGIIRFAHDSKPRFTKMRWVFITLFSVITLYLLPGVTNTKAADLTLISGFPPPMSYSIYKHPVNSERIIEPLRDYEQALQLAKAQHKPLLIDFTGWACVNCRRMEEKVWPDAKVAAMMKNDFIVVSLYVDERKQLPAAQQLQYTTKAGAQKPIVTVGDKWATFQSENFNAVSQPQYAIISPDEKALTKTKAYTPSPVQFADWLQCGLKAYKQTAKL